MVADLGSSGEELVNATFVSPCVRASIVRQTDRQSAVRTQLSCVWETPRSGASFEKKGAVWNALCAEGAPELRAGLQPRHAPRAR